MSTTRDKTAEMTDESRISELMLVNLFAVFSERDPERRPKAIAANYTEDVIWSSPEATTHGHECIERACPAAARQHARFCIHGVRADPRTPRSGLPSLQLWSA